MMIFPILVSCIGGLEVEPEMYHIKIGKHLVNLPLVLNYFYDDSDNLGGHFNISSDTRLLNPES